MGPYAGARQRHLRVPIYPILLTNALLRLRIKKSTLTHLLLI
jgi:hypothetical protein